MKIILDRDKTEYITVPAGTVVEVETKEYSFPKSYKRYMVLSQEIVIPSEINSDIIGELIPLPEEKLKSLIALDENGELGFIKDTGEKAIFFNSAEGNRLPLSAATAPITVVPDGISEIEKEAFKVSEETIEALNNRAEQTLKQSLSKAAEALEKEDGSEFDDIPLSWKRIIGEIRARLETVLGPLYD